MPPWLMLPGTATWPDLIVAGFVVGIVAGMFGVGGGFLLTPVLLYVFRVPAPLAVGSALCQQVGVAVASFLKYRALRRGEVRIDLLMLGGSLLGVDAGGRALAHLARAAPLILAGHSVALAPLVLDTLFVVMLGGIALYIFRDAVRRRDRGETEDAVVPGPLARRVRWKPLIDLPNAGLHQVSAPLLANLGFGLGFLSGIMGVGGGVLLLPILMYGFGMRARDAAGTGVLLLFVTVSLGTLQSALRGTVSLPLAMGLLIGSSIGAQIGALITSRLPDRTLRLAFASLVACACMAMAWNLAQLFLR